MPEVAPTWILLRGLSREKAHWGNFLESFAKAVPGQNVLAIDLPGSGEYLNVTSPRSIPAIFNFVRAQAVAQAVNGSRFKILAVSLGGMIAMEWMRQKPEELSHCVLVNSSSKRFSPFYNRLRWQIYREFFRLLSVQSARERERGIIELLMNNASAREAALPLWTKIATERPISYINFFNQLLAASKFEGLDDPGPVPTLLLSSLGDKLVDPSCSTELHRGLGWPVHRHPWGGHDLPWDDPQWVLDQTTGFA